MTPAELIRQALESELVDEDGNVVDLDLLPPLADAEIAALEARIPCPVPDHVRELLRLCRGVDGSVADILDFTGESCSFELAEVFPHGLPIAADGFGNFWVVDLMPTSHDWGPIYFACHDPPVILFQCATLAEFLHELLGSGAYADDSAITAVHDDQLFEVWATNPRVLSHDQCSRASDPELRAFAAELDPSFQVIDLRDAETGFGFSWGRYGPNTVVRRFGALPIFAYQQPRSLLQRLFSK